MSNDIIPIEMAKGYLAGKEPTVELMASFAVAFKNHCLSVIQRELAVERSVSAELAQKEVAAAIRAEDAERELANAKTTAKS